MPGLIPSTVISIVKPFIELCRTGRITAKITLEAFADHRDIAWADLVVFCRNTEPTYVRCLDLVIERAVPYIYDLDDNFFEIYADSAVGRYYGAPERLAVLTRYIAGASLVRVYSEELLKRVQTMNSNVVRVDGPLDLRLIHPRESASGRGQVRIVYATSRRSDVEFDEIYLPALMRVLDEYSGQIEMHFRGHIPAGLRRYPGVYYHKAIKDYDRFLYEFARAGYDIALAPLRDDSFCRSKSNNKFREYGGCGIAGIYSDVAVYSECLKDGETGLLVSNKLEAWHEAIVRLIRDRGLREKIGRQAKEYVWTRYSQEKFERVWLDQILDALDGHLSEPRNESLGSSFRRVHDDGYRSTLSKLVDNGISVARHLISGKPRTFPCVLLSYKDNLQIMMKMRSEMAKRHL